MSAKQLILWGHIIFTLTDSLLEPKSDIATLKKICCNDDWDQRSLWSLRYLESEEI